MSKNKDPMRHRCRHVEIVARSNADGSVESRAVSRCTLFRGHGPEIDHGFTFELGEDDHLVSMSVRHEIPRRPAVYRVLDDAGRLWKFDPPVVVYEGDSIVTVTSDEGVVLTVGNIDGVTTHIGTPPSGAVADARPTMDAMRHAMGLGPIPPESVIGRDERYQDIPVVVPPSVPEDDPRMGDMGIRADGGTLEGGVATFTGSEVI